MSVVTNIMLAGIIHEDDVDKFNAFLKEKYRAPMNRINREAGGNKAMEADVWGGAYNHFDEHSFIAFLRTIKWYFGVPPTLLINRQEDDHFFIQEVTCHEG